MQANKTILLGGVVILSIGAINAAMRNKPETPVFMGGIGVILLASILDLFGEGWATLAGALVWLAVVTVLIVEGPSVFQALKNAQSHKGA